MTAHPGRHEALDLDVLRGQTADEGWLAMSGRIASVVTLLSLSILIGAGCGSSKPEYCSKADDLQGALDTLKGDVSGGNVSAISSDLQAAKTDLDAVASSAKADFPSETRAMRSSLSTLTSAIEALPSSPSSSDLVGLAGDVVAVKTAVDNFKTATSSECD
jgi:hypothetical protein